MVAKNFLRMGLYCVSVLVDEDLEYLYLGNRCAVPSCSRHRMNGLLNFGYVTIYRCSSLQSSPIWRRIQQIAETSTAEQSRRETRDDLTVFHPLRKVASRYACRRTLVEDLKGRTSIQLGNAHWRTGASIRSAGDGARQGAFHRVTQSFALLTAIIGNWLVDASILMAPLSGDDREAMARTPRYRSHASCV